MTAMSDKSYNQYCAAAHALDQVGERWTLLIVRNLLIAPQRFSDLRTSLPGISTNILTDRLKGLEKHGVVATRYLPPPAASTVYELTERGYALTGPLAALAQWGSATLGAPQKGQSVVTEGVCFMIQGVFGREDDLDVDLGCNIHVQDEHFEQTFGVTLSADGVKMAGELSEADVEMHVALEPLNILSAHRQRLQAMVTFGLVSLNGNKEAIDTLHHWIDG